MSSSQATTTHKIPIMESSDTSTSDICTLPDDEDGCYSFSVASGSEAGSSRSKRQLQTTDIDDPRPHLQLVDEGSVSTITSRSRSSLGTESDYYSSPDKQVKNDVLSLGASRDEEISSSPGLLGIQRWTKNDANIRRKQSLSSMGYYTKHVATKEDEERDDPSSGESLWNYSLESPSQGKMLITSTTSATTDGATTFDYSERENSPSVEDELDWATRRGERMADGACYSIVSLFNCNSSISRISSIEQPQQEKQSINKKTKKKKERRQLKLLPLTVFVLIVLVIAGVLGAIVCGTGNCGGSNHSEPASSSRTEQGTSPVTAAPTIGPEPSAVRQPTPTIAPTRLRAFSPVDSAAPTASTPESKSPTSSPTTRSPTVAPTTVRPTVVLTTTQALRDAVDAYLAGNTAQISSINEWDVSQINDFSELFSVNRNPATANFNADLDLWDTGNVVTMQRMFAGAASFNGNVSTWNTSSTTDFSGMFRSAKAFNSAIGDWDTSKATDMSSMLLGSISFDQELAWNTANVLDMTDMFRSAVSFNQDLNWDTGRVNSMSRMFQAATSFKGTLNFGTGAVTDMSNMFAAAASFEGNGLSSFDTARVSDMQSMFFGASSLVGEELVSWNVQNVFDFSYMFAGARAFNQNLCPWRSQLEPSFWGAIGIEFMFAATSCPRKEDPDKYRLSTSNTFCSACDGSQISSPAPSPVASFSGQAFVTTQELRNAVDSYIQDSSRTSETAMKYGYPIGNWDVSKIEDFSHVFNAKSNPRLIHFDSDLTNWDLSSAINTDSMFEGCLSFTDSSNSLAGWKVSKVVSMQRMFESTSFTGDISRWDIGNVRDFGFMFQFNSAFQSELTDWRPSSAENTERMFRGATSFSSDISSWNLTKVTTLEAMFSGATNFNENLCRWQNQLPDNVETGAMFVATSCPSTQSPARSGSDTWCQPCS